MDNQPGALTAGQAVDLDAFAPEPDAVRCISDEMARTYSVLPLRIRGDSLYVAMADPKNVRAVDDIRFVTKKTVVPLCADPAQIARAIDGSFMRQRSNRALEDLKNEYRNAPRDGAQDIKRQAVDAESEVSNAPAVRLTNSILNESVTLSASDIHLEPFEDGVRVRYRIDGSLSEHMSIPSELYSAVSTRVKIMAGMDIAEKRLPQDGRVEMEIGGAVYDFRVSSLPTVYGEKLEIRKLDRSGFSFNREMLSFTERENAIIDSAIGAPRGIVLVTGPTGSGKTTTIYSLLCELNRPDRNIVTIEDPVEYMVRGVNQVQVNAKAGLTFAGGLRSILRQDPDVIMIGEIRDEETAEIAVRAAITGHLVLSTLHTNDAPGSVTRLMDMGIPPYLLSEAVTCVVAQRLVRRLCAYCKTEREASAAERAMLKLDGPARVFDPAGCPRCGMIGYKGRQAIHETLHIGSDIKNIIEKSGSAEKIREKAAEAGMTTLFDNCRALVLEGRTSVRELVNTVHSGA